MIDKNQKGFTPILVILLVLLVGVVGYFMWATNSEPPESVVQQQIPVESQGNIDNKPFAKIREDAEATYYEGYVTVSGTYSRGVDSFLFDLDPNQEYLFSSVQKPITKRFEDEGTRFVIANPEEALKLLPQKTKLSLHAQKGAPCSVMGKATVVISNYIAPKILVSGNYNQGVIEKVLSTTGESYTYWEQRTGVQEEILDCTGETP